MHAAARPAPARCRARDPGARVRAAQRRAPQHAVGPQVGRVGELALDLGDAVGRADALADPAAECPVCDAVIGDQPPAERSPRRCRARSPPSSPVSSRPSSTTVRPPTSSRCTWRARAEDQRGDRVRDAGMAEARRGRQSAMSASLPGSSEPISSARPRQRAPRIVPSASASRAVSACGPPRSAGHEQRLAQLAGQLARLVRRGAVDAQPDRRAGARRARRPARCRRPSRAFDDGQCATPVAGLAEAA